MLEHFPSVSSDPAALPCCSATWRTTRTWWRARWRWAAARPRDSPPSPTSRRWWVSMQTLGTHGELWGGGRAVRHVAPTLTRKGRTASFIRRRAEQASRTRPLGRLPTPPTRADMAVPPQVPRSGEADPGPPVCPAYSTVHSLRAHVRLRTETIRVSPPYTRACVRPRLPW
jgi:hypothetical protein